MAYRFESLARDDFSLKKRLYEFRFKEFILSFGESSQSLDYFNKMLIDAEDNFAETIIALDDFENIIGSVRGTQCSQYINPFSAYIKDHIDSNTELTLDNSALLSKFAVAEGYRNSLIALQMLKELIIISKKDHIHYIFLECLDQHLIYYNAFGFQVIGPAFFADQYCALKVTPMKCLVATAQACVNAAITLAQKNQNH